MLDKNTNDLFSGELELFDDHYWETLLEAISQSNKQENSALEINSVTSNENQDDNSHRSHTHKKNKTICNIHVKAMAKTVNEMKKTESHPDSDLHNLGFRQSELGPIRTLTKGLGRFFIQFPEKKQEARALISQISEENRPFIYDKKHFFNTKERYSKVEKGLHQLSYELTSAVGPITGQKRKSSNEFTPNNTDMQDVLQTLDQIEALFTVSSSAMKR